MMMLPHTISWFCLLRKLEAGLCGVCDAAGRDRASRMGKIRNLVKLSKTSWVELKKEASISMMMMVGIMRKAPIHMYLQISMIYRSEHLA
jgi:hypothetical protein